MKQLKAEEIAESILGHLCFNMYITPRSPVMNWSRRYWIVTDSSQVKLIRANGSSWESALNDLRRKIN